MPIESKFRRLAPTGLPQNEKRPAARRKGGAVKQLRLPHVPVMTTKALVRERLEGFALRQRARDERRQRQLSARRSVPAWGKGTYAKR
jgi:hypothetical protein